jgi:large subunit ribosomal protein L2
MSFYGCSPKKNKIFTTSTKSTGGRNNTGTITVRHRGTKKKNTFFSLDHKRNWSSLNAVVLKLNLNKKKTFCALIKYLNGSLSYVAAPFGLFPGNIIKSFNPIFLFKRK